MGRKLGLYKDKKHSERSSAHGTRDMRKIRSRCEVEEACGVGERALAWFASFDCAQDASTVVRMQIGFVT